MAESVSLETTDKIHLAADFYPAGGDHCALLLHMMPATKDSWRLLAERLAAVGISSLAFDFRGHGQSTDAGKLDYHHFTAAEQQAKIKDVQAGFAWLRARGFAEKDLVLVGASIGANLALQFLAAHPHIPLAIALSPGLDYHGVQPLGAIQRLKPGQLAILVASDEDQAATEAVQVLKQSQSDLTTVFGFHGLGHGTDILDHKPEFIDHLLKYFP